jgi:hypothetical protein
VIEEWRAIPGFPGYEVSDLGRVRSWKRFGGFGKLPTEPKPVVGSIHKAGYPQVNLTVDGKKRYAFVHRLVLETFVGPCPVGMECAHLNGVRSDARLSNLEWKTHADNELDKVRHGTVLRGSRHGCAVLDEYAVQALRIAAAAGMSHTTLAKLFMVDRTTVGLAVSGKTWSHVKEWTQI